jgi:ribonuclease Z
VCLGEEHGLLIDCGVSPRGRLEQLGADQDRIRDVFISHFHPDHAAGLVLYLMELCLCGRSAPLCVHSGVESIRRIRTLLDLYGWKMVPGKFPVSFHTLKGANCEPVVENQEFRALSSPVRHVVPTLGIRVEDIQTGKSFVYSADTEPSAELTELARGTDLLIHEATGAGKGHSSAAQAAAAARDSGAGRLLLIHTNPYADPEALLDEAGAVFPGDVGIAADKMKIDW